jgi:uncharacterized protein
MDMSRRTFSASLSQRQPELWTALGLIALYFLLQLVIGGLTHWLISFATGFDRHGDSLDGWQAYLRTVLDRPAANALMVIVTLPLATLAICHLAQRYWPELWALQRPPGLGMTRPRSRLFYAVAIGIGLLSPPIGGYITQLLAHGEHVTQNVVSLGHDAPLGWRVPLLLVVVGVGPLVEELLFRGVLLSALMRRMPTAPAVLTCVLLFAGVHLPGLDFKWYALPDLMLLAAALCWLRLQSGSLWPAVLAHGANNLFAMLVVFSAAASPHV